MTGLEMMAMLSKLDSRRVARHWLAAACCLPTALLGGCCVLQRCETWDRVTHPDYMYEEHTTLHGFHRTSWDTWPEAWNHRVWSHSSEAGQEADPVENEELPTGDGAQDLPAPESDGPASQQSDAPQARARTNRSAKERSLRPSAPTRSGVPRDAAAESSALASWHATGEAEPRRLNSSQSAVDGRASTRTDNSPEVMALKIEQPLTLDSTPAPWANRFASLIATDRKSRWRELKAAQAEKRIADAAAVAEPTPLAPTSPEETPADAELLPTRSGDATVQFRASPANALPTEAGVSSDVESAPAAEPEPTLDAGEE